MGYTQNDVFPSKYLKAASLSGKPIVYTIHSFAIEELGDAKERKPVLYFTETNSGLVLNKTRWTVVEELYGPDTDGWVGNKLELFPDKTRFGGKTVPCISVRAPVELNDAVPF
jgi:hypothetical protein